MAVLSKAALGAGVALTLAGCAAGPDGQGPFAPGPLAGLASPFSGPVDPDLRGRIGGPLDTSGAATAGGGGVAVAGAPAAGVAPGGVSDPFAGEGVRGFDIPPAGSAPQGAPTAAAVRRHTVVAGETAWSIARKNGVTVQALAAANALPDAMTVRTGQKLAIPAAGAVAAAGVTAPGAGSPTPLPPSAAQPLPGEATTPRTAPVARPETPDLGATRTAASGNGRFRMPVQGSIVRAYAKGSNEGIDISAPAGTAVRAAGSGTVAAITRDTNGVPIVVVRHDGTLMTVYAGLDGLSVRKGDRVEAGQTLGKATGAGVVHFEVRQGFDSVDPEGYLG